MTIDSEVSFLDSLKRRFAYHEWCDLKPAGENVFVDGYLVTGSELRGWHLHRVETLEGPPPEERAGVLQVGRRWPGVTLSLWNSQVRTSDALVRVDTFECRSMEDSREVAVRLLGEFQSPNVARRAVAEAGEVAFAGPGDATLLFTRGNLVFLVRNAGRTVLDVTGIAGQLDASVLDKVQSEGLRPAPHVARLELQGEQARTRTTVPLDVQASDPLAQPIMHKYFSATGEVFRQDDRMVYRPTTAGSQEVTLCVVAGDQRCARRTLQFEAS